jgi:hypothetical protein
MQDQTISLIQGHFPNTLSFFLALSNKLHIKIKHLDLKR